MQTENARNTVVFIVCAAVFLIAYQFLVLEPQARKRQAETQRARVAAEAQGAARPAGPSAAVYLPRQQAATASPRVRIDTPALAGSLSLRGGRIDDLFLKGYRETIAENSPNVELFRPEGAQHAYFAEFGWAGQNVAGLPGDTTVWTQTAGSTLAPNRPVTLRYDNGTGLMFTRQIAVDDRYVFTVSDTVANRGDQPVELAAYGSLQRQGLPPGLANNHILHEGAIGVLDGRLNQFKFKPWREDGEINKTSTGGWLGITDKYWLGALMPAQDKPIRAAFRVTPTGRTDVYEAVFTGAPVRLAPGTQTTVVTHLFAGAKRDEILDAYAEQLNLPKFDDAIDWGSWFWWITRPVFTVLEFFHGLVGNFGIAILLLTVTVKLIFFPLANKSFESMSKMKKLSPEMQRLKEKYPDDPAKQQQELLALYQREKVNPLMGCLPLLVQIPVFYALYKTLFVTIEMRHAPFFGWIRDLSDRDPTSVWTLFGLVDWNVAAVPLIGGFLNGPLHIGLWPLFYGLSMWLQTSMNPPAPDPMQQRIFQLFPIIFTFVMAPFAVGLIIYWTWNNFLTILQQYVIMHRFKVDNPIDSFIAKLTGKPAKAA